MADEDRSSWLAGQLAAGVAALRAGRPHDAVPLLVGVCDDPEFVAAADMVDIRSRATSLYAQALLLAGRPVEALPRAEAALALARTTGDTEGVHDIEQLRDQIRARMADVLDPRAAELAIQSVEELERSVRDPLARAELLVRKANAEIGAGRAAEGVEIALRALALAPSVPRIAVLARLTVARGDPAQAAVVLPDAVEIARAAEEFTLVGLVAKAAELAGVVLEAAPIAGRR